MSNNISFNEEEFVTSTQNLNDSDAIDKCIHLMLKKETVKDSSLFTCLWQLN